MTDVKTNYEQIAPCEGRLTIEIPAELIDKAFKQAESKFKRQARIPGFRPGKAPKSLIYSHHGDQIKEDVLRTVMQSKVQQALSEQEKTFERTELEDEENLTPEPGKPLTITVKAETTPEFELPEYRGLELPEVDTGVSDSQVEGIIENVVQSRQTYQDVDRPAAEGDLLQVSYKADCSPLEQPVPEASKYLVEAEDTWLTMSEPEPLPGLIKALEGIEAGSSRDVDLTFPEDFHCEALAGKTLSYHFDVKLIRGIELAEFSDEMAQEIGYESADAMREQVRSYLQSQQSQASAQHNQQNLMDKLTSMVELELPPTMLEQQKEYTLSQLQQERMKQGESMEDMQGDVEGMHQQAEELARKILKFDYIIHKIAEKEEIQPEESEIQEFILPMMRQSGQTPKKFFREMERSGRWQQIAARIVQQKTVQFLLENANFVGAENGAQASEEAEVTGEENNES